MGAVVTGMDGEHPEYDALTADNAPDSGARS